MISKIWDAVNDPLMGMISDNTRSRIGRRRPFLLIGNFAYSAIACFGFQIILIMIFGKLSMYL